MESTYIKEISEPDINEDDAKNEAAGIATRVTFFMSSDTREHHTHTHTNTQNVAQLQIEDFFEDKLALIGNIPQMKSQGERLQPLPAYLCFRSENRAALIDYFKKKER